MHVRRPGKFFSTAEANENERRWNEDKIGRKNQDPTNHYDKTRMKLNFEIGPDGKIHPLGYQEKSLQYVYRNDWPFWVGAVQAGQQNPAELLCEICLWRQS